MLTKSMILREIGKNDEGLQICLSLFAILNHYMSRVKFKDDIEIVNPYKTGQKYESMKGPRNSPEIDGCIAMEDWLQNYPQKLKSFVEGFVKKSVMKKRNSSVTTGYEWFSSCEFQYLSSFGVYLVETMGLSKADFLGNIWIHVSKLYVAKNSIVDAKEAVQQALSLNALSPSFHAHVSYHF
jgi:hypothetical protein